MTKRIYLLLTLLITAALVISACGGAATPEPAPAEEEATEEPAAEEEAAEEPAAEDEEMAEEEMAEDGSANQYGQITDVGGIDDKGFNQLAWEGMQRAAADLGVDVQFLESQQQTDYEKNINEFLNQDYNGIVTIGFLLADATRAASEANPDIPFAIVDSPSETDGTMGLLFAVDEPSFLAGYLAAGMTETGTVCTYGGIKVPPVVAFLVGFENGVNYYNEQNGTEVNVLGWQTDAAAEGGGDGSFTGNFESLDDGRSFAENFFDEGCDIIFPVAGPVGLGSAAAAQDRGFAVIGVDADMTQTNPDATEIYMTSVLKKIDVAVYDAVSQMETGEFEGGSNYVSTLENDGVGLAPYHDWEERVPAELTAEIDEVRQGIIAGEISTGWPVSEDTPAPEDEAAEAAEEEAADEEAAEEEAADEEMAEGEEEMADEEMAEGEEEAMEEGEGTEIAAPAAGELGSPENPINVLFVPSAEAGVIVSGGEVMAQALNEATGLTFNVDVPTSYAATVEAMCASPEDTIGFIPALGYVLANNRCGVEAAAAAIRRDRSWYAAQFLVSRDSGLESVEDLAGLSWAVPDLGSTSGYLYPSVMLQEAGVEPSEIVEAGGHSQSVLAVYNGEVDFSTSYFSPPETDPRWEYGDTPEPYDVNAVAADCTAPATEDGEFSGEAEVLDARCTVLETAPDVFEQVGILTLSQQIPNDSMSFSPDFPQELREQVVAAVVEFAATDACQESLCSQDFYAWDGLEPVEDSFFDPVRSLINILGYTEEDIFN